MTTPQMTRNCRRSSRMSLSLCRIYLPKVKRGATCRCGRARGGRRRRAVATDRARARGRARRHEGIYAFAMHRIIHYPRAVKVAIAKDERCNPYRLHACMKARHASWHPAARGNRIRTKSNRAEPDRFEYEPSPTQWHVFAHIATHRRCNDTCRRKRHVGVLA